MRNAAALAACGLLAISAQALAAPDQGAPDDVVRLGPAQGAKASATLVLRTDEGKVARHHALRARRAAAGNPLAPLTAAQVTSRFGASPASVRRVRRWAAANGLRVRVSRLRTHVVVRGRARDLSDALGVPLFRYGSPKKPAYVAGSRPAQVPRTLRRDVRAVSELGHPVPRHASPPAPPPPAADGATAAFDCKTETQQPGPTNETPATPLGMAQWYQFDKLGASANAPAQTVAVVLVGSGPPDTSHFTSYVEACRFGQGPGPTLTVTGASGSPGPDQPTEATNDVSMIGAVGPANMRIAYVNDDDSIAGALDRVAGLAKTRAGTAPVTVVSMSLGANELCPGDQKTPPKLTTCATQYPAADAVLSRLGAMGVTVVAAAGDWGTQGAPPNTGNGSWSCEADDPTGVPNADYPASSPWVTGVGGTQWSQFGLDGLWHQPGTSADPCAASAGGGGPSIFYAKPAWQPTAADGKYPARRSTPDIALLAGPPGWVQRPQYPQGWSGGTSAAAPLLAAAIARLNADRLGATPKKQPLGYLNPTLYGLTPGAFADIRTGTNDLWNVGCCSSGTGYDATTGLGTPLFGQSAWSSIP